LQQNNVTDSTAKIVRETPMVAAIIKTQKCVCVCVCERVYMHTANFTTRRYTRAVFCYDTVSVGPCVRIDYNCTYTLGESDIQKRYRAYNHSGSYSFTDLIL